MACLSDANTQSLITQFNSDMLQRNRLAENSSEDNLLVKDLDGQMASLRQAILTSLDNYIKSLNIQISSTEQVQRNSDARVIAVPRQAGEILSDERQPVEVPTSIWMSRTPSPFMVQIY